MKTIDSATMTDAERIRQLEELLRLKDEKIQEQQNQLEKRQSSSTRPDSEVVFTYGDLRPFVFSTRDHKEQKTNVFNYFNDFRRPIRIINKSYKNNPNQEMAEFAKMLHSLMIENAPNNEMAKKNFYKCSGMNGERIKKDIERLKIGYHNHGSLYVVFCDTFKEHIEPHDPFMMELENLRDVLYP